MSEDNLKEEKPKKRLTLVTKIALFLTVVGLLTTISISVWLVIEYDQVSNHYEMNAFTYKASKKGVVYTSDGVILTYLYQQNKEFVPLDKISKPMQEAIIALEDHRFLNHFGVDTIGTLRALYKNVINSQVMEGGSTITQQLVRNLFLTPERTFSRKLKEMLLAINVENRFTKDQILEMYLNEIYFGNGCYGIESAAMKYFGKHAADLDLAEATMLAAIPRSPNYYEPLHHPSENRSRQENAVNRMVELKLITKSEALENLNKQVKIKEFKKEEKKAPYKFPYFTTVVINQLIEMYGKEKVYNGGLEVITTLDSRAAQLAENIAKNKEVQFRKAGITASNMAIVSVNTTDGAVISLLGGTDFCKDQNNLAIIPRQPGSAIKPLNYAGALDQGIINENSMLNASAKSFGKYYVASNLKANVSVLSALKHSMNVPAVEVVNAFGITNTIENLKRFGITSVTEYDTNLAIALGGMYQGIKPLEMAAAFAVFGNYGIYHKPYVIKTIKDAAGEVLYQHKPKKQQIISPKTAQVINQILLVAVRGGTGTRANISGNEAGKTGTTNDSKCLWFVGYNNEISTAVWVGNTNNSPVRGFYGGDIAAPIWREYMLALMSNQVIKQSSKIYPTILPIKERVEHIPEKAEENAEEVVTEPPPANATGQQNNGTQSQASQETNPPSNNQDKVLPEEPPAPKPKNNEGEVSTEPPSP